jgi:hypothetical protein
MTLREPHRSFASPKVGPDSATRSSDRRAQLADVSHNESPQTAASTDHDHGEVLSDDEIKEVSLTFASWNQLERWLRGLDSLRSAA